MKLQFSFLPIPEELMRSKAISWGAKYLFGIYAKANKEKIKWSSNYLAIRMDCEQREVISRKKELRENNLIIVVPRKGRVDEVSVNFELVNIIQTPEQMLRTGQIGQGGTGQTGQGSSKEHSIKETPNGGEPSSPISVLRKYFTDQCKQLKGFEPEMSFGKEGKLLKEKLKRFSVSQLKGLIDQFFNSRIGDDLGFTLGICLSAGVINLWQAGKLEKIKKPYYLGDPMIKKNEKWFVISKFGEWLEFADKKEKIEWQ